MAQRYARSDDQNGTHVLFYFLYIDSAGAHMILTTEFNLSQLGLMKQSNTHESYYRIRRQMTDIYECCKRYLLKIDSIYDLP